MTHWFCISVYAIWLSTLDPPTTVTLPAEEFQIQATAQPQSLLLSSGGTALVQIRVLDAQGAPVSGARVEGLARHGRIDPVQDRGFGRYEALYHPPPERYPQLEMLVWRVLGKGVGWLPLPLIGSGTLEAETRPRAKVRLIVQDRTFGPGRADALGLVRLPFEAPPGITRGTLITGEGPRNELRKQISLSVPQVQSLLILADRTSLVASRRSEALLQMFVADEENQPLSGAALELKADRGKLSPPVERGPGLYQASWLAPDEVLDGTLTLQAQVKDRGVRYRAVHQLRLVAGPPTQLLLRDLPESVAASGRSRIRLEALLKDEHGNPTDEAEVSLRASWGEVSAPTRQPQGGTVAWLEFLGVPGGVEQIAIMATATMSDGRILRKEASLAVARPSAVISTGKKARPFWRSLRFYKWSSLGASVLTLAPGAALLALDGRGTCGASAPVQCPEIYDSRAAGISLLGVGSALLATTVVLFVLDREGNPAGTSPQLTLQPIPGGAVLALAGWLPF